MRPVLPGTRFGQSRKDENIFWGDYTVWFLSKFDVKIGAYLKTCSLVISIGLKWMGHMKTQNVKFPIWPMQCLACQKSQTIYNGHSFWKKKKVTWSMPRPNCSYLGCKIKHPQRDVFTGSLISRAIGQILCDDFVIFSKSLGLGSCAILFSPSSKRALTWGHDKVFLRAEEAVPKVRKLPGTSFKKLYIKALDTIGN